MVVEEHMVCVAFNRMYCATYWFNPNILLHEKHYMFHSLLTTRRLYVHTFPCVEFQSRNYLRLLACFNFFC